MCVTGANGFIGSHVVEMFEQEGVACLCLVRPGSPVGNLLEAVGRPRIARAHLESSEARDVLVETFRGVDCVIHVAGRSSDWGRAASFERANVQATRNVFLAAHEAGVRRIILAGSISSYGESDSPHCKDEDWPANPLQTYPLGRWFPSAMNHYRRTKWEATRWAMEFAKENDLHLTVLEPVWIFGERESSSGFYEYLDAVRSFPVVPGSRTNLFPVLYVRDLARAFLRVYRLQRPGVERFIVGSLRERTMEETHGAMRRRAGIRPPWLLPRGPSMILGTLLEFLWTLAGSTAAPPLTRSRVAMMFDSIRFSAERFHRVFGPFPETPFHEAIERTVSWYACSRGMA